MPVGLYPIPGSFEEKQAFKALQQSFTEIYDNVFNDRLAEKTVVVVPSLSLDTELLIKLKGHIFYEERLLCMLMLLRMPRTKLIFVSSIPIDDEIISYCLHLLPGVSGRHARQRLSLFSCYDSSSKSLTQKILERPRLIERINRAIEDKKTTHLSCFNVTELERTLAVQLGIPVYGTDPDYFYAGTKSGSRRIFKNAGILMPKGIEDLKSKNDIITALVNLKKQNPHIRKAVIKMNDGFSGEGNAVFKYPELTGEANTFEIIEKNFERCIKCVVETLTADEFIEKFQKLEGIVEAFIEGEIKTSPSVQCRIEPNGQIDIVSTHDQHLTGEDDQVFVGAHFPANIEYNKQIADYAYKISEEMAKLGVLGRFSVDFISVKKENKWTHYAIEINLRKGGTTHPFLTLQFLTDGVYDAATGIYTTAHGSPRYYFSTDNIVNERYKGLTPHDLVDIAAYKGLLYDNTAHEGVMFHMVGALSQYGKLGIVSIGATKERAVDFFNNVVRALDEETQ